MKNKLVGKEKIEHSEIKERIDRKAEKRETK